MPWRETLLLAIESIRSNKLRAGLTMLGLIIGVGAVVLLVSIGTGARNYITRQFESLGTNLIIVQPGKRDAASGMGPPVGDSRNRLTLGDVEALQRLGTTLDGVSGIVIGSSSMRFEDRTKNSDILGCGGQFFSIFNVTLQSGDFFTEEEDSSGRRVVILGYMVAKGLFPEGHAEGQMIKINESEFRVAGVIVPTGSKMGWNIDEFALIPTKAAMRLFNQNRLFGLRARAKVKVSIEDAIEEVREVIKSRNNGEDDITIFTQNAMLESLNTILSMLTWALGGIALISLIVGGIGIMNIMLVSVTERTREIGIRRAVGARRRDIMNQFLAESTLLSLIGGGIGLLGSGSLTYLIYWALPNFDMRAPPWVMVISFALSSFVGIAFGVWPARKASHIETIEALRYE